MEVLVLLALGFLPGAFLFFLILRLDRRSEGEGAFLLLAFLAAGALSVLPGLALYAIAGSLGPTTVPGHWGQILFIWTINAPVEEVAKFGLFLLTSLLLRSIRQPQDGALQGAVTGLGFGVVENLMYGFSGGWPLLLLRSVVSLPGHVIYGAVWGGYYGFEVYQGRGRVRRWSVPLMALVPAAFAHALFNTLVLDASLGWALAGDALTFGFGLFLYLRLRSYSPSQARRPLKEWRLAIPETEHALALDPTSPVLKRSLAAYYLAAGRPDQTLATLADLADDPWTQFYRAAAHRQKHPSTGPLPPEALLDPRLFARLSGG